MRKVAITTVGTKAGAMAIGARTMLLAGTAVVAGFMPGLAHAQEAGGVEYAQPAPPESEATSEAAFNEIVVDRKSVV